MTTNNEEKFITIHIYKALGILAGAIIVSIVGTAFAVVNTLNTDHFTLLSISGRVAALENTYVKKEVYETQQENILEKFVSVNTAISELKQSIRELTQEVRQK